MILDRKTIEYDEEYLRQISEDIDFEKDDYKDYINRLKDYCDSHAVYSMAPVQIGIPKRIIYIKNTKQNMENNEKDYNENIVYINPVIIKEEGKTKFLEGCESCVYKENDTTIYYTCEIERPYSIEIEYYDMDGKKNTKTINGFEATVFYHEYDHLNGILHMDKANEIFKMTADEMKAFRSAHPYEIISEN